METPGLREGRGPRSRAPAGPRRARTQPWQSPAGTGCSRRRCPAGTVSPWTWLGAGLLSKCPKKAAPHSRALIRGTQGRGAGSFGSQVARSGVGHVANRQPRSWPRSRGQHRLQRGVNSLQGRPTTQPSLPRARGWRRLPSRELSESGARARSSRGGCNGHGWAGTCLCPAPGDAGSPLGPQRTGPSHPSSPLRRRAAAPKHLV